MKINLSFIPQNTAPLGARSIGLYDSNGNKLINIPLGNLAPKSTGNILYRFGALSDVHLPYNTGPEDFARALNYFNDIEKVDFICISGDMGSTGVDSEWASFKNYVDTYSPNTTVHISAGNHDAGQSAHKTHDYPIPYTGNPLYYSFTQGDDVFIMFGMTFWGNPPFSKESLQWLYETLEENRNKRCFVFQHMMRKGHAGDASGRYTFDGLDNTNGKVFLSLMEHYKNVLWFHGHSHCEFEQQDTLALPNSNYDRAFGCHSIHIPSCCMTRNESNSYDYEDSEGYVVDVYKNGIHLRARDFIAEKFLPIASYWIDTTPTTITANSYADSTGTINTGSSTPSEPSDGITLPEGSKIWLNQRYSQSKGEMQEIGGVISVNLSVEPNTTYKLTFRGSKTNIRANYDSLYFVSSDGVTSIINGNSNISKWTEGAVYNADYTGVDVTFTTEADTVKIWFSILFNPAGTYIHNIDEITDVVLTLEKTPVEEPEEPGVNIVPTLLDTDLTNVFNGIGYKENVRVRSTGELLDISADYKTTLTGLIPLEKDRDVLHVRGTDRVLYVDGRHVGWCSLWDSTGAFLESSILLSTSCVNTDKNGDFTILIDYAELKVNNHPTASYIRLQVGEVTDALIITRNQLITVS